MSHRVNFPVVLKIPAPGHAACARRTRNSDGSAQVVGAKKAYAWPKMKLSAPRLDEARWIDLPSNRDARGVLTSIESDHDTPFPIKRIFYMHHVVADRGGHAHMDTDQVVTAVAGSFDMELTDGKSSVTFRLDDPARGVYVPRMLFIKIFGMHVETVCLVLASTHYDMSRSLRSHEAYLEALALEPS